MRESEREGRDRGGRERGYKSKEEESDKIT